jgi:PAS domain S-box-containing protein
VIALAERCARTGEPFTAEYRYLAADGRVVWVLDRATLRQRNQRGEPRLFQGVMLDITARKGAEEQATVAEERFRALLEDGPVGSYVYELVSADPLDVRMRYVSPRIGEIVGYPTSHWQGDPRIWVEMTHPDDRARLTEAFAHWSNGEPWSIEYRMIAGDGHIVWVLDRGRVAERGGDGSPKLFQGVIVDVTDIKERAQAVEASEARLRAMVEMLPAVPWTEQVDPVTGASRYVFIGSQIEAVFGWSSQELMMEPDHFFRLVHPDDQARLRAASDRCDATGEPWDELYRVVHRDGSVHWIVSYADRAIEDGRPVWHGVSLDVTRHVATGIFPVPVGEGAERPS